MSKDRGFTLDLITYWIAAYNVATLVNMHSKDVKVYEGMETELSNNSRNVLEKVNKLINKLPECERRKALENIAKIAETICRHRKALGGNQHNSQPGREISQLL